MKVEVILGLLRHVLTLVGGYYVASGKADPSSVDTIIGGICGIVGAGWSIQSKRK
jgi:hypothetical protein